MQQVDDDEEINVEGVEAEYESEGEDGDEVEEVGDDEDESSSDELNSTVTHWDQSGIFVKWEKYT